MKVYECTVRWCDEVDANPFPVRIAVDPDYPSALLSDVDDYIFFYVKNEDELRDIMGENHGEDFDILSIDGSFEYEP